MLEYKRPDNYIVFWDVDAPATLERVDQNPDDAFRACIPRYDFIFTYGGGPPVVRGYESLGAQLCVPIYNGARPGDASSRSAESATSQPISAFLAIDFRTAKRASKIFS